MIEARDLKSQGVSICVCVRESVYGAAIRAVAILNTYFCVPIAKRATFLVVRYWEAEKTARIRSKRNKPARPAPHIGRRRRCRRVRVCVSVSVLCPLPPPSTGPTRVRNPRVDTVSFLLCAAVRDRDTCSRHIHLITKIVVQTA